MKSLAWTLVLLLPGVTAAATADGYTASFERGRELYEAHCQHCHTPSIHARPNQLPLTRDELAGIVDHFRRTVGLAWTPEEIEDVVEYLDRTRYRFPPQ
jgi:mono/diheme cytochrome c family protein